MKAFILIFLGGGLGAMARYGTSSLFKSSGLLEHLTPNLVGCFMLGFALFFLNRGPAAEWRLFLMVGFLGSYTTFSSYIYFIHQAGVLSMKSLSYILLHHILALAVVFMGAFLAERVAA